MIDASIKGSWYSFSRDHWHRTKFSVPNGNRIKCMDSMDINWKKVVGCADLSRALVEYSVWAWHILCAIGLAKALAGHSPTKKLLSYTHMYILMRFFFYIYYMFVRIVDPSSEHALANSQAAETLYTYTLMCSLPRRGEILHASGARSVKRLTRCYGIHVQCTQRIVKYSNTLIGISTHEP